MRLSPKKKHTPRRGGGERKAVGRSQLGGLCNHHPIAKKKGFKKKGESGKGDSGQRIANPSRRMTGGGEKKGSGSLRNSHPGGGTKEDH